MSECSLAVLSIYRECSSETFEAHFRWMLLRQRVGFGSESGSYKSFKFGEMFTESGNIERTK